MYLTSVWLSQSLSMLSPQPHRHLYYSSFIKAAWECPFGLQNVTTMQENSMMSEQIYRLQILLFLHYLHIV